MSVEGSKEGVNRGRCKERASAGLATGGMVLTALGWISYVALLLCAIVFVVGLICLGVGSARGWMPLPGVGFLMMAVAIVLAVVIFPVALFLSWAQIAAVVMQVASLIMTGKRRPVELGRQRVGVAIIGLISGLGLLVVFGVIGMKYRENRDRERYRLDSGYILRVAEYVGHYGDGRGPNRFAPALAAVACGDPERFEMIMAVPRGGPRKAVIPFGTPQSDWRRYEAAIDAASDYRYVGADLEQSQEFQPLAHRIVILYNKESYGGGRTVAFADRTQRFVKEKDLAGVFADASAARASLGLPEITVDGPAPKSKWP